MLNKLLTVLERLTLPGRPNFRPKVGRHEAGYNATFVQQLGTYRELGSPAP